jgi:peptidoglycan/LPS O-acetylase OafA/YrhL
VLGRGAIADPDWLGLVLGMVLTLVLALAMLSFIENPCRAATKRWASQTFVERQLA